MTCGGARPLTARDASEVTKWETRIDRCLHDTLAMNATARFWLYEIDEVFKAARRRLNELVRNDAQPATEPGTTVH